MKHAMMFFLPLGFIACAKPNYVVRADRAKEFSINCPNQFRQSKMCVNIVWQTKPTETDFGSFTAKFANPENPTILVDLPAGNLEVVLWMPSMGHGSSPVTVEKTAMGIHDITNVFFTMKGAWEIRFQLKNNNTVQDEAIVPITI